MPSGLAMCGNTGKVELGRRAFASQQKCLPPLGNDRSPFRLFLHSLGGSSDFTFVQLCLEAETEQAACARSLCARTPICSLCLCRSVSMSGLARIGADWHGLERIGLFVGSVLGGVAPPPVAPPLFPWGCMLVSVCVGGKSSPPPRFPSFGAWRFALGWAPAPRPPLSRGKLPRAPGGISAE